MSVELLDTPVTVYTLPADGEMARAVFVNLLQSPGETWLADYGFTEADLVAAIEQADALGVPIHLLLDRSQSAGTTERAVLASMVPLLQHGDVTISTAGPDSRSPSQILHTKAMVVRATDGGEDYVWIGSVNFSESGWLQANIAVRFRSTAYGDIFRAWFTRTKEWARVTVPQLQTVAVVTTVVTTSPIAAASAAIIVDVQPQGGTDESQASRIS